MSAVGIARALGLLPEPWNDTRLPAWLDGFETDRATASQIEDAMRAFAAALDAIPRLSDGGAALLDDDDRQHWHLVSGSLTDVMPVSYTQKLWMRG